MDKLYVHVTVLLNFNQWLQSVSCTVTFDFNFIYNIFRCKYHINITVMAGNSCAKGKCIAQRIYETNFVEGGGVFCLLLFCFILGS